MRRCSTGNNQEKLLTQYFEINTQTSELQNINKHTDEHKNECVIASHNESVICVGPPSHQQTENTSTAQTMITLLLQVSLRQTTAHTKTV